MSKNNRRKPQAPEAPKPASATTDTVEEITEDGEIVEVPVKEPQAPEAPKVKVAPQLSVITLDLPVCDNESIEGQYVSRDLGGRLTIEEAKALKRVCVACAESGAKLKPRPGRGSGKLVEKPIDAIHYILERIADAA